MRRATTLNSSVYTLNLNAVGVCKTNALVLSKSALYPRPRRGGDIRQIYKKEKGKNQRRKARQRYARKHLRVNRQRNEHAKRIARNLCKLNSLVAYEDLNVKGMVRNHCLAKSINDVAWSLFRRWLEYFARKFNTTIVAVNPRMTSQKCSDCGAIVKKSLSTRTHKCSCGCEMQRDVNAAINILNLVSPATRAALPPSGLANPEGSTS